MKDISLFPLFCYVILLSFTLLYLLFTSLTLFISLYYSLLLLLSLPLLLIPLLTPLPIYYSLANKHIVKIQGHILYVQCYTLYRVEIHRRILSLPHR